MHTEAEAPPSFTPGSCCMRTTPQTEPQQRACSTPLPFSHVSTAARPACLVIPQLPFTQLSPETGPQMGGTGSKYGYLVTPLPPAMPRSTGHRCDRHAHMLRAQLQRMSLPRGTLTIHVSRRATKPRRDTLSLSLSLPSVTPQPHNTCLLSPARPTHSTLVTRRRGVADSSCSPRQACGNGRLQTLQGFKPEDFTAGPAGRRAGLPDRRQRRQRI